MLLIDFSQVFHASVHSAKNEFENDELAGGILHHYILLELRNIMSKYRQEYGRPVFCIDDKSKKSWRKELFPYYKAARKERREEDKELWDIAYPVLDELIAVLKDMKHIVMSVPGAEADDVIAVLAKNRPEKDNVLIVSSDGDFKQLHKYPWVRQYSPIQKKDVVCDDPDGYLIEHIAKGEGKQGDGIPNIFSPNDWFVNPAYTGKRQKAINKKILAAIRDKSFFIDAEPDVLKRWQENKMLIDFDEIPADLQCDILETYQKIRSEVPEKAHTRPLYKMMVKKRMVKLLEDIQDFA